MSTTLNDTMDTARDVLDSARESTEHAVGNARHAMDSARKSTGHAVSSARSTLLDGVKTVTSVVGMLRDLGVSDALGWVGLARRRSPLLSVGIFGAGVAVGAGVGVLLAPMSGGDLRRAILNMLRGATDTIKKDAHEVSESAQAATETAVHAVKDMKDAATETAVHAVKDVKNAATETATRAVKDVKDTAKAYTGLGNGHNHRPS